VAFSNALAVSLWKTSYFERSKGEIDAAAFPEIEHSTVANFQTERSHEAADLFRRGPICFRVCDPRRVRKKLGIEQQTVRMIEALTIRSPKQVYLKFVHALHPNAIHEFEVTKIGYDLVCVAAGAVKRRMFVENIANECKVAKVLALPIGTGRVRGGEGGVEVGFRT